MQRASGDDVTVESRWRNGLRVLEQALVQLLEAHIDGHLEERRRVDGGLDPSEVVTHGEARLVDGRRDHGIERELVQRAEDDPRLHEEHDGGLLELRGPPDAEARFGSYRRLIASGEFRFTPR